MPARCVPDADDAVGTADIADDPLRADRDRPWQRQRADISVQHGDPLPEAQVADQGPGPGGRRLEHFHRIDVLGTGLDTQPGQHRVFAGADVEHDLATHRGGEGRAVGGQPDRFGVHQAVQPLVVDPVGSQ